MAIDFHTCLGPLLALAVCASCSPPARTDAEPAALEVAHSWTSAGESLAIQEVRDAFEDAGGEWRNFSLAGFQNTNALMISRIIGGQPPGAMNFLAGPSVRDLAEHGLLVPLDEVADAERWSERLPASLYDALIVDGRVYSAPLNIHVGNWLFASMPALREAGVDSMPASWPDFFDDLERLKKAGLVPLAFGGQAWQEAFVFSAILHSKVGAEAYVSIYADHDQAAINSPAFRDAVETFGRLRNYVDPGSPGRNWNDATGMLIAGRAGFQIMGDWAQAEFRRAGLTPDRDFGCAVGIIGGGAAYISDVFVFPRASPQRREAQLLLARVATDPEVQARFARRLGALPAFSGDAPPSDEICDQRARAAIARLDISTPEASVLVAPDVRGDLEDVISAYWAGEISEDTFIQRFATILATAT